MTVKTSNKNRIKRVIGVGDRLVIRGNAIFMNGQKFFENYLIQYSNNLMVNTTKILRQLSLKIVILF
ncbi:S26 family signal peptidase [Vagococcus entomophilus]|uniref:S26 family signal peptidase n=1 Tax=Vagococcus entomophilus TaxID=1160095 RepID=UPI0035EB0526